MPPSVAMTQVEPVPIPHQDPQLHGFMERLKCRAMDSDANKETVDSYLSFWEDRDHLESTDDHVEKRRKEHANLTNHYYNLVTDFYEYGWGQSFHFARMFKGDTFIQNLSRHENFLAMHLNLRPGMRVLDVGCGVGGPAREIAKTSGASVVGINNNAYQVERFNIHAERLGLSSICKAIKGNFMAMPFSPASFDAVYSIEATCHAPTLEGVFSEVFKVLKPGGLYTSYEWTTTATYDETDLEQKRVIHAIEEGDSISKLSTIPECLTALKKVGFEILEAKDLCDPNLPQTEAMDPWYRPLEGSYASGLMGFRMTPIGRWLTHKMVTVMEKAGLAPKGTREIAALLNKAADNLVEGGRRGIFTPMFWVLVRKPYDTPTSA